MDKIESMWSDLFSDSVAVEHSLGSIKKTFTEVPFKFLLTD